MLSEGQVQQFNRDGYLKGGQILSSDEVDILQDEMERIIRDQKRPGVRQPVMCSNLTGDPNQPVWQIVNIWQASDAFERLVHHPVLARQIAQLLDAPQVRLWHDQIQYKPAGTGGINMWHQDWPYWPILSVPDQVTAWVALDDVDEENGCMKMVPGSHQWGNTIDFLNSLGQDFAAMPATWEGRPIEVRACPVPAGGVHFHHGLTWHGSNRNRSGRKRRAVALHFMGNRTRYRAAGVHVMKRFVQVPDGALLEGDHFPQVWQQPPSLRQTLQPSASYL
jgi:phytanoyl-CoA hydroxylase